MKNRSNIQFIFTVIFCIISISLAIYIGNDNNYEENLVIINTPESSLIQASQIEYEEEVDRVFGNLDLYVNLSVGTAEAHPDAIEVNMTITFNNGTIKNYTQTTDTNDVWNWEYVPYKDAPLGVQTFNITAFTGTNYYYSDNYEFNILDSYPNIGITLQTTEIYRNNTLNWILTPSDAEDSLADLTWSSGIYRASNNQLLSGTLNSLLNRTYEFEDTFENVGGYYVEATVEDKEGNSTSVKAYFTVKNNIPEIVYYNLEFSDSEITDPDQNELLRDSGTIDIEVNATDIEKALAPDLKLKIIAYGPDDTIINLDLLD
ncbi:MAG: hypothetical protein GF364_21635, partial [Candidatus Lokiarchaeota archaeon]|nr:hypothetical protein [Candidatus Lokiarchaeota archaeon]